MPQTGRNFTELLRAVDSVQLTTRHPVATPANWRTGEAVVVNLMISDGKAMPAVSSAESGLPGFPPRRD